MVIFSGSDGIRGSILPGGRDSAIYCLPKQTIPKSIRFDRVPLNAPPGSRQGQRADENRLRSILQLAAYTRRSDLLSSVPAGILKRSTPHTGRVHPRTRAA